MKQRCNWGVWDNSLYLKYHDEEWGVPVHNDRVMFEFLLLEGFQAGLSWSTVLRKRENFRRAFNGFDPQKIVRYGDIKKKELLSNPGIIRNRLKIDASVRNAGAFLEVQKEFGTFDRYIWQFVGGKPIVNQWKSIKELPVSTPESDAMSRDLKKRGFSFVGTTICYAHMQAVGMVNDHTVNCFRYREINEIRTRK